jgi:hypothetical protein
MASMVRWVAAMNAAMEQACAACRKRPCVSRPHQVVNAFGMRRDVQAYHLGGGGGNAASYECGCAEGRAAVCEPTAPQAHRPSDCTACSCARYAPIQRTVFVSAFLARKTSGRHGLQRGRCGTQPGGGPAQGEPDVSKSEYDGRVGPEGRVWRLGVRALASHSQPPAPPQPPPVQAAPCQAHWKAPVQQQEQQKLAVQGGLPGLPSPLKSSLHCETCRQKCRRRYATYNDRNREYVCLRQRQRRQRQRQRLESAAARLPLALYLLNLKTTAERARLRNGTTPYLPRLRDALAFLSQLACLYFICCGNKRSCALPSHKKFGERCGDRDWEYYG